jgi:hypothetical protein
LDIAKQEVVKITRSQLTLLEDYIGRKEREGSAAEPVLSDDQSSLVAIRQRGDDFIMRLQGLPPGRTTADDYQRLIFEILNYLFEPELTDGEMEVKTYLGTERRDIIYVNEAETSFWAYVRTTYGSPIVMFEIKNVSELELDHVNQTANYLGANLGMLGFIVTRTAPGENILRKTYSTYNNTPSIPRKTILILTDNDLCAMIHLKQSGQAPGKYVRQVYVTFRKKVQ